MENKDKTIDLAELTKAVWTKKRKLLVWGAIGLVVGLIVAFSLPKEYQSNIKIAPESKHKSGSMGQLGGFASMMGVNLDASSNGGIDESVYPEIIKSAPFIAEFAAIEVPFEEKQITLEEYLTKEQKGPWWSAVLRAPMQFAGWLFSSKGEEKQTQESSDIKNPSDSRRAFESALSGRMKVVADKKSGLITLDVQMQSPTVCLIVADSLFDKLSRYMRDYYTAKARNDLKNSEFMFRQAREQYYAADTEYAIVVDRNQNLISKSAQIKVERYKNERDLAYMVYQQLAQQVESNKIALQQDTPIATIIEPARIPHIPISPNKKSIIIVLTFLGVLGAAVTVVVKQLIS